MAQGLVVKPSISPLSPGSGLCQDLVLISFLGHGGWKGMIFTILSVLHRWKVSLFCLVAPAEFQLLIGVMGLPATP